MSADESIEIDEPDDDDEEGLAVAETDTETSLDEIAAKAIDPTELEEEEESVLELTREERLESLSIRATPKQSNEFVCASCHLVKHKSQLADKKRELCRDCV